MLAAQSGSMSGESAPFLVAPNLSIDGLSLAIRSGENLESYFAFMDERLQQLLGNNFTPAASATSGSLHAIRFTTPSTSLHLGVTACAFCPTENRRPSPEEAIILSSTSQSQLFSLDRLYGQRRRDYSLRNHRENAGGNLCRPIAAVVNMLYLEQFALCSMTSFVGARDEGNSSVDMQLNFYLPHDVGGLLAMVRWQEVHHD